MKMKCLVLDDEQLARKLLANFIAKVPHLELVKSCKNPLEALSYLQQTPVDLLFLDIQMPDLTGIELLKSLPRKPHVVLTTAYQDYALEGYQLNVLDYLLKPFSFERFVQSVNKATELVRLKQQAKPFQRNPAKETHRLKHLIVHADHKIYKLQFDEINYIEGMKEYVAYHLKDKRILALQSMKHLAEILPKEKFIRIHRSYIVSFEKINMIEGNQVLLGEEKLPIGRTYKDELLGRMLSVE